VGKRVVAREARKSWDDEHARGWRSATKLFAGLQAGQALTPLPYSSGLLLNADEIEYAAADAEFHRYYGTEGGSYVHSTLLMGGPWMMVATGVASAVGNRSRRTAAEFEAMARWRPGGRTRAVLTSARLLISAEGQWMSYYFGAILEIQPDPAHYAMVLAFEGAPPLSLRGPWVPYLSVALLYLLHGRADPRSVELPSTSESPGQPRWSNP